VTGVKGAELTMLVLCCERELAFGFVCIPEFGTNARVTLQVSISAGSKINPNTNDAPQA
jgi:hypothetical protein